VHWDKTNPLVTSVCGLLVRTLREVVIVERVDIGTGILACQRCEAFAGYPLMEEPRGQFREAEPLA
jgi:hypothetical protein